MANNLKQFPEGFYWGAATAAYQVEGGIENTDWAQAAREGTVPPCGRACDHYHQYEEDFDMARDLGHNAHRFSVEWARIEPEEGRFDEEAIEHYREVLRALRARNLKPFITLWHFTLPLWFSESGGFERKDAPEIFARYCRYVAQKLGNDCRHFSTMNEPTVFASKGWLAGDWPPFKKWSGLRFLKGGTSVGHDVLGSNTKRGSLTQYFRVLKNLARAHNAAYDAIKTVAFGSEVGIVHHIVLFHANGNPFNKVLAWFMNWHWTHQLLRRVQHKCDSIGVNYYLHKKFGDTATYEKTDMGWDVYPEGLCEALLMVKRYKKPVYVSEAGIADAQDTMRADYIRRLIDSVRSALEQGADIRGFMYWSLLDNYEWALGFEKRFGLIEINYETLARTIRPSAYVYTEIIRRNGRT